jgi:hypothetical protein
METRAWSIEDAEKLEFLFKAGKSIEDLTEIFDRKEKFIIFQLTELELIDQDHIQLKLF